MVGFSSKSHVARKFMNTETLQIVSFLAFLGRRKLIPPNKPISLLVPFVSHRTEHRLGIILSNLCKSAPVGVALL